MEDLNTIEEWLEYINQIPMMEMIVHAKLIGSVSFQEDMDAQGYDDEDLMAIYMMITKRFLELDIRIPEAMEQSCIDFRELAAGVVVPN
jgi:hypothetical protein